MPLTKHELLREATNTQPQHKRNAVPFAGRANDIMRDLRNRLRVLAVFCAAGELNLVANDLFDVSSCEATIRQVHV